MVEAAETGSKPMDDVAALAARIDTQGDFALGVGDAVAGRVCRTSPILADVAREFAPQRVGGIAPPLELLRRVGQQAVGQAQGRPSLRAVTMAAAAGQGGWNC
jgi:hypothetical protein